MHASLACAGRRLEAFLGDLDTTPLPTPQRRLPSAERTRVRPGFAWVSSPPPTTTPVHSGGGRFLSRPPFTICGPSVQEFLTCSPSPTPPDSQRPRLRIRLTLGRLPLPRNPQASGVAGSYYRHSRYSFRHSRLWALHQPSRSGFSAPHNAPLPCRLDSCTKRIRGFGGLLEPRYVVGARALDQ